MAGFQWLDESQDFNFPPIEVGADLVAAGGNLSPGMLLSAYRRGIFPWFSEGEPILWWCLDPRFVLFPDKLHISRSMIKLFKKDPFVYSMDTAFEEVIRACSSVPREGQDGTWITEDMVQAYCELNRLGWAHSIEVWKEGELCGGFYGISMGHLFFGESMFARHPNASKAAFIRFCQYMAPKGLEMVDCQTPTLHLGSLGAIETSRTEFLNRLHEGLNYQNWKGNWGNLFSDFTEDINNDFK